MTTISVSDCKVDNGYLSEFVNVNYKKLPMETEMKNDELLTDQGKESSAELLQRKILVLTDELNEMKNFMAVKMRTQVIKFYHTPKVFYEVKFTGTIINGLFALMHHYRRKS